MVGETSMTIIPHDFQKSLKFSEKASHEPFWDAVYRKAFPGMVNHMLCSGDVPTQRMGVDRLIYLNNNRELRVDEKKRLRAYPDILLEYISNDRDGAPGWMEKNLVIDYLAYAFMPTQRVYMYDWLTLRRAWVANAVAWKKRYKPVIAQNVGYKTLSVPVPIGVLQKAMYEATCIDVKVQIIEVAV